MANRKKSLATNRRNFLGSIASGVAAMGLSAIPASLHAGVDFSEEGVMDDPDEWFNKITGKHRVVFDVIKPNGIMPFAWPRVFLLTNNATGTPDKDCSVVVILRHDAIPYAMGSQLWGKYKFGEFFEVNDMASGKPATSNPFWKPAEGTYKVPGFGTVQIGINELQASGVMFCVCNAALTVNSAIMADKMKMDAAALKKEWVDGLLPDIQVVPSGVWAAGRAQEHKCAYIYAS